MDNLDKNSVNIILDNICNKVSKSYECRVAFGKNSRSSVKYMYSLLKINQKG